MALTNEQIKLRFLDLWNDVRQGVYANEVDQPTLPVSHGPVIHATMSPGVRPGAYNNDNKYLTVTFPSGLGTLLFEQRTGYNLDDPTIYINDLGHEELAMFRALNGPEYLTEPGLKLLETLLELSCDWEKLDSITPPWEMSLRHARCRNLYFPAESPMDTGIFVHEPGIKLARDR